MTGPQILRALDACALVRATHPDVPIVWGGIHPTLLPEQTLEHPLVDIIVAGEGEATFAELVKALEAGAPLGQVKGIWHTGRWTGAASPGIARSWTMTRSRRLPTTSSTWTGTGGAFSAGPCELHLEPGMHRFGCAFCWEPAMNHRRWRAHAAGDGLDHVKRLVRDYGIRGVLFADDNFFVDMGRAYRHPGADRPRGARPQSRQAPDSGGHRLRDGQGLSRSARAGRGQAPSPGRGVGKRARPETAQQGRDHRRVHPGEPHARRLSVRPALPVDDGAADRDAGRVRRERPPGRAPHGRKPARRSDLQHLHSLSRDRTLQDVRRTRVEGTARLEDWAHFNYRNVPRAFPLA